MARPSAGLVVGAWRSCSILGTSGTWHRRSPSPTSSTSLRKPSRFAQDDEIDRRSETLQAMSGIPTKLMLEQNA